MSELSISVHVGRTYLKRKAKVKKYLETRGEGIAAAHTRILLKCNVKRSTERHWDVHRLVPSRSQLRKEEAFLWLPITGLFRSSLPSIFLHAQRVVYLDVPLLEICKLILDTTVSTVIQGWSFPEIENRDLRR